jgi:hypothetical protein
MAQKTTHKVMSERHKFTASFYTKGSKLNEIYSKMSRREFIKSLLKFEWLWTSKN